MGNLTPRPYLGLPNFTLSYAVRSRADEDRTLVDYCYRSFFTLGCISNKYRCPHCHDLPIEGSDEWELLKVGLARVAQRNKADNKGFDFTACIKARGLTIADVLAQDLPLLPLSVTKNDPCMYYFSTQGCWSPSCRFIHARPEVGSFEWNRLRNKIEYTMALPCNIKFNQYRPIGYLGMTEGFKIHLDGLGRCKQRKLVAYCLPSFTTKGCANSRCNLCHDLPIKNSDDWSYLKDALFNYSLRKLSDFDILPIIKERGIAIRCSTATADYAATDDQHNFAPQESSLSPVSYTDHQSASIVAPRLQHFSTVAIVESEAEYISTALIRAGGTAVMDICKANNKAKSDGAISSTPCVNYQSESGCHRKCGRYHSRPEIGSEAWWVLREDLKRCVYHIFGGLTLEPLVYLGMDPGFAGVCRASDEPLVDYCYPFFTTAGCHTRSCRRCHLLPVDGSSEWSLFKDQLISYVEDRLARTPNLDFTSIIKDRVAKHADARHL